MSTGWTLAGTNLRTVGYDIRLVDGWDSFPARRSGNNFLSHRHGEFSVSRKFYTARQITLAMTVLPLGSEPTDLENIQTNIDTLLGICHANALQTLGRTMPDLTNRYIDVEIIDGFIVESGPGISRQFVMLMNAPWPFWRGIAISELTKTGTFNVQNDGNAPVADFIVQFNGAGKITHNGSGAYLDFTAAGTTVVDLGERTAKQGSTHVDQYLDFNEPWWMELEPGANSITYTGGGSVNITGNEAWF